MTKPAPGLERPVRPAFPRPDGGGRPGIGGGRPSIGGEMPSIGMTKPAPGFERPVGLPGSGPQRPGIGGNRPGVGWNRPDNWNRPGIGDNNNIWNNGNVINNINNTHNNWFTNNNINNRPGYGWNGGGWGLPGYGGVGYGGGWYGSYGNWGNHWYNHCVNPGYAGWYHGCWNGNWGGYNGGWWAPFLFGAATWGLASTCTNWGLGYSCLGYGAGGYVNPYYASIPAAVVAASPYDYSQPIIVNNYIAKDGEAAGAGALGEESTATGAEPATKPAADPIVEKALADFKNGEYDAALAGLDKAVKASPKDSVLHEVRAVALFALGRYDEAAAALNAVLAAAPGMDWTTMSGLYGSVDDYTTQLRRLEAFCKTNPGNAAAYFVLAYHYLVGGHADLAADALEVVVAKQPGDAVAKRLLDAITPPAEAADSKDAKDDATTGEEAKPAAADDSAGSKESGPETDLVGSWKATIGDDAVELTVKDDFTFTWKATPKGQPAVELSGKISTTADAVALESEKAGTMLAKVKSQGADTFEFALVGAPKDAKPLVFQRRN